MALTLDASTPAVATQTNNTTATVSSPSFTPPANSILMVGWAWNSGSGGTPGTPTIADNRGGAALTYSLIGHRARPETAADGQAAMWWARVSTVQAMTITVTSTLSGLQGGAIYVWAVNGAKLSGSPIGASGEGGAASATTSVSMSYNATGNNSMGFGALADWAFTGSKTAGSGTTVSATGNAGSEISYGFARRTAADGVNGGATAVNLTTTSSNSLMWVFAELLEEPAAAAADPGPLWTPNAPAQFGPFMTITPWGGDPAAPNVVQPGDVTLTPAVALPFAVALSPVPQPVTVALSPAVASFSAVALSPVAVLVSVNLAPATASLSAVAVAPVPQPVTLTLAPAVLTGQAVSLSAAPGPVSVSMAPAPMTAVAVPLTPVAQPVTVNLTPAVATLSGVALSPVPQPVTVALTAASATLSAIPLSVGGTGAVALTPAVAALSARPLALTPGVVTTSLAPAALATSARPLAVTPGAVTVALAPSVLAASAVPLTFGSFNVPGFMSSAGRVAQPLSTSDGPASALSSSAAGVGSSTSSDRRAGEIA